MICLFGYYKTPRFCGGFCVCSAVSYFSTLLGSIIGAGRLSFRVRDGTGRFPAAVAAVTLFTFPVTPWWGGANRPFLGGLLPAPCWVSPVWSVFGGGCGVVFCGVVARQECVLQYFLVLHFVPATRCGGGGVVSFRPVSTSSLNTLRCV